MDKRPNPSVAGMTGSTSRQAPLFLFFDACKEWNVFQTPRQ